MRKGKLLIIDDESPVRDTVVGYLEDSQYEVIEASNGEDGLQLFRSAKPDLVLCDLKMPKIDGLVVLKTVLEESPNTPFIVVSGAGVMSDVVEALRLGASDYLVKPLSDLAVLEHSIEKNLSAANLMKQNESYRIRLEQTNQQLEADLKAGRKIQQRMLPDNRAVIHNYRLEHQIFPSHYLSGDFVDYFELNDHQFLFFIADVSGHGVSSAIITVLIKNYLQSLRGSWDTDVHDQLSDPSRILAGLNQYLIEMGLDRHATMFVGVIDSAKAKLIYSCAAHFPTPILKRANDAEALPTDGLPVGLLSEAVYRNREKSLADVSGMFLCSDGLLEIMDEASLVQKETRLLEIITESNNSLSEICAHFGMGNVEDIPDDITLLSVNNIELI
ncbi:SpoIIE family protein phosphatase [Gynuella sp.]|uniref:SpoIIE family protein phosphatase n=1 Tax=Gynuella sp. TaxID=2969146 RepID=UPI003D14B83E